MIPEVGPFRIAPEMKTRAALSCRFVTGSRTKKMANLLHNLLRLDYVSCVLTILATILLGRKLWLGWVVAAVNSAVVCVIGVRTAQFGFVPANLLCIALYTSNLVSWRLRSPEHAANEDTQAAS